MYTLEELTVKFGADLTAVDSGFQKLNSTIKAHQDQIKANYGAIMDTVRNAGLALTAAVTVPVAFFLKDSIDTYARLDALKKGLVAVTGSGAEAAKQLKDLKEVAKLPGLGFEEAVRGATQLQATGMKAKEAKDAMMAFGNAVAQIGGGKTELGAVLQQIMQMRSNGKVMTEDLRIIKNYVPQISKAMETAYGTSNAEQIQKMGIKSQDFINRMAQELSKLPRVTGGLKNDLDNLLDSFNDFKAGAIDAIKGIVSTVVNKISNAVIWFNKLGVGGKRAIIAIIGGLAGLGPALLIISKIPAICSGASLAFKGLGIAWRLLSAAFMASKTTNPIGWILLAVTAVIGLIALIVKYRNQLGLTDKKLKEVKAAIMGALKAAWDAVKPAIQSTWNALKGLYAAFKPILNFIGGAILLEWKWQFEAIILVIKALCWVVKQFAEAWTPVIKAISTAIDKLAKFLHLKGLMDKSGTKNGQALIATNLNMAIKQTQRAAKAMLDYKTKVKEATDKSLENAKSRIDALKQEIAAEREKRLQQVGFSSLRGMWEKQMEAGAKERVTPKAVKGGPSQELSALEKQVDRQDKIIKLLEDQIRKYDSLVSYA